MIAFQLILFTLVCVRGEHPLTRSAPPPRSAPLPRSAPPPRELDCECGGSSHVKVADGKSDAPNHAWPWMASIVNVSVVDSPVAYCGGTLISDRYVLTAAHCIEEMNETGLDNFRVYLGTNYINGSGGLSLGIADVIVHPRFSFDTAENDIALLRLESRVGFRKYLRPVCLQQLPRGLEGVVGVITGWGSFNLTQPTELGLKETQVLVVSTSECRKNYSTVEIPVTEDMLCAALPGSDPCKGDSGGPLVVLEGPFKYTQVGIISHGQGCSVSDFPAIFTRVSSYLGWIRENTKLSAYCKGSIF